MRLYSMPSSGNSYKVRLLLALSGQSIDRVDVEYGSESLVAAHNKGHLPLGKAPVLALDDCTLLPESNAILCYLGRETPLTPADPLAYAQMLAWMFWEQNQHEAVIAVRAALLSYPHRKADATPERLESLLTSGNALLQRMEDHLSQSDWFAGDAMTLADICLYAYTHTAETRGGYDLAPFPALRDWLARIKAQPGYVGLHD